MADLLERMKGVKDSLGQGVVRRWKEIAPGEHAEIVYVSNQGKNAWDEAKARGDAWIVGTSVSVPALAGAGAGFRLANPAGSGQKLIVAKLTMYSTIRQLVQYREDATLPAPNAMTPNNFVLGAGYPAPNVEAQWDDSKSADGTLWGNRSQVDPVAPLDINIGLVLLPGKSLVVQGESSAEHTATVNGYFFTEAM